MMSIAAQIATLLLAGATILWGVFAAYGAAFPASDRTWAVLAVYATYGISVPVALITFAVSLTVRQGSACLRRLCLIASLVVLTLPFLVSLISRLR